jgi:hypothetical protein
MARKKQQVEQTVPDRVLIVTSRGVELECSPIAAEIEQQENNIRDSIDWPAVPTRTIEDVAGSTMTVELTQEYVDSEHSTDGEKEAWTQYRADLVGPNAEFTERLDLARPRLIALRGVKLVEPSLMDEWTRDHEWMGMSVPEDAREKAYHFFMTEILGSLGDDMSAIMVGIYRASGYDSEVLDKVEQSFRAAMGKAGADGHPGNTEPETEAS